MPAGRCPGPYLGMLENSSDFLRVCLKPQGLFRSIATVMVSAKEGVYAVVGKLRDGSKETVTSELVFDREKGWTDEKAAEYVKEHSVGAVNEVAGAAENLAAGSSVKPPVKQSVNVVPKLDPYKEIERSRRLLSDLR